MTGILYTILLFAELILAPLVFILLFFITAPYGRFVRKGWGAAISSRAAWIIMESPSLVIPIVLIMFSGPEAGPIILLAIWLTHYFHRSVIYPFRISDPEKPFSLIILSWGFLFNLMNSYINFRFITAFANRYGVSWFTDWKFIAGFGLFVCGFVINKHSDAILRGLRSGGKSGYSIPQGGLYRWVSAPNYLGEIIEWGGWALLTWSLPGLAFVLFTIANLFPRALKNHKWYKEYFSSYPEERKAIIPYIC